jgi:hypothetical protein
VVFVDHATEHPVATHQRSERHDDRSALGRWPLVARLVRLVRPMIVVMPGVGPHHRPQMGFVVDQHPVRARGPYGAHPPFRIANRPGHPRRVFTTRAPSLAKTSSNAAVNLASRSRMRNRKDPIRSARSMPRLRAC